VAAVPALKLAADQKNSFGALDPRRPSDGVEAVGHRDRHPPAAPRLPSRGLAL